jgi:predicted dehydrogenase
MRIAVGIVTGVGEITNKLRIGIVGAGWWSTQHHIPGLLAYPSAEIVGIADRDPSKLDAAARAYGIKGLFSDHREMLERAQPQGVIIAVPHAFHYPIARDVLQAGVSALVEKPMTLRAEEAWDLVGTARERGVHLTVGYPWNYTRHARAARDAVRSGEIGDIQLVSGLFASMVIEYFRGNPEAYRGVFKFPVTGPNKDTYSDPTVAGGGQAHLQVTHFGGLMFWVTGLRAVEVFAYMENHDVKVDLVDAISLRFDNGALGVIGSTGGTAPGQRQDHELRIYGTKGSIIMDPNQGTLSIHPAVGEPRIFEKLAEEEIYPAEATGRNLVDVLAGAGETSAPGELGARVVEMLDAAYRSSRDGRKAEVRQRVSAP